MANLLLKSPLTILNLGVTPVIKNYNTWRLDLWKSRGASGRCPISLRSLDILVFTILCNLILKFCSALYLIKPFIIPPDLKEDEGWKIVSMDVTKPPNPQPLITTVAQKTSDGVSVSSSLTLISFSRSSFELCHPRLRGSIWSVEIGNRGN